MEMAMAAREALRFVIVGHVDHGKSTLIGRLLFDTDSLPLDRLEEARQAAKGLGREFEFAFLLDHLQEEREEAMTIDTTQTFFRTQAREYVIIDAPGHVEFLKNMITGASQAEAAILIIDVTRGVQEQTRRHAAILKLLGLEQVIVVLNKMDLVGYREEAFSRVKEEVAGLLDSLGLGLAPRPRASIPISAKEGDNVAKRSEKISWYRGPTVLEALDSLKGRLPPEDKPLILPIQDVYELEGKRIIVGRVEAGAIREGEEIRVLPEGWTTTVGSIEKFLEEAHEARAGESIGLTIRDSLPLARGQVICRPGEEPPLASGFEAHIFWLGEEGARRGEELTLRCATQEVSARIAKIRERIDTSSLEVLERDSEELGSLEVGRVLIRTAAPVVVERFEEVQELGRFVLLRGAGANEEAEEISAGGIITGIRGDGTETDQT